ncbi:MAG TPA: hypothetical protein ENJ53_05360 [Phaeodactylibacter sp.]|nr:hypothetical protein [Phaeodactylibacter sp.]
MKKKIAQYPLIALLLSGAVLCIFTPPHYIFRVMTEYAVQVMFGYLFLGLFFLLLKQPRLMFVSFFACSALALHLKTNSNSDLKASEVTYNQIVIDVALVDVSNINDDPEGTIDAMLKLNTTILSISDINPLVYEFVRDTLSSLYPYTTSIIGFDPGIVVFSKYEIHHQEAFFVDGLPNVIGSIQPEQNGQELYFIASNTLPPFYAKDYERLQKQLQIIADKANEINSPILTFADYNLVQWSDEIHDFRAKAGLKDSRRGFSPASSTSIIGSLFYSPRDHIFFSEDFKCIGFENLKSSSSQHLGIKGSFQFNFIVTNDKKTNQEF